MKKFFFCTAVFLTAYIYEGKTESLECTYHGWMMEYIHCWQSLEHISDPDQRKQKCDDEAYNEHPSLDDALVIKEYQTRGTPLNNLIGTVVTQCGDINSLPRNSTAISQHDQIYDCYENLLKTFGENQACNETTVSSRNLTTRPKTPSSSRNLSTKPKTPSSSRFRNQSLECSYHDWISEYITCWVDHSIGAHNPVNDPGERGQVCERMAYENVPHFDDRATEKETEEEGTPLHDLLEAFNEDCEEIEDINNFVERGGSHSKAIKMYDDTYDCYEEILDVFERDYQCQ